MSLTATHDSAEPLGLRSVRQRRSRRRLLQLEHVQIRRRDLHVWSPLFELPHSSARLRSGCGPHDVLLRHEQGDVGMLQRAALLHPTEATDRSCMHE